MERGQRDRQANKFFVLFLFVKKKEGRKEGVHYMNVYYYPSQFSFVCVFSSP